MILPPWMRRQREFYLKATTHAANMEALGYLKSKATPLFLAGTMPWSELAYGQVTHPDLATLLPRISAKLPEHYFKTLYGFEVIATPRGVLCALVSSLSILAFRLPEPLRAQALQSGGALMPQAGKDWAQFDAWEPQVSGDERTGIYTGWCRHAYDYSREL
jgi:hypothetical protein